MEQLQELITLASNKHSELYNENIRSLLCNELIRCVKVSASGFSDNRLRTCACEIEQLLELTFVSLSECKCEVVFVLRRANHTDNWKHKLEVSSTISVDQTTVEMYNQKVDGWFTKPLEERDELVSKVVKSFGEQSSVVISCIDLIQSHYMKLGFV